ncbi:hypothetical protein [Tahibacter amnicola]|uniref:Uncharacterized protein n=1 Tax=Tahibacter amnicola TaxID=2976241 RepID=A0ABY6BJQ6_9GAMM|nr:hypothetical protein [Tahibacter amnicola]UXI69999.1 hypothetical protein N4264_10340 [Tahibacter amnicola]
MRTMRTLETRALGYTIERVDERDHLGTVCASWFEVLCPQHGNIIGSAATRSDAERIVIRRELELARRPAVIQPAVIKPAVIRPGVANPALLTSAA